MSILKDLDEIKAKAKKTLAVQKTEMQQSIKKETVSLESLQKPGVEKSKQIAGEVLSKFIDNTGIIQKNRAAVLQKKREQAREQSIKNGIPLAPNGDAYDMNDIKYLLDKKYTKEDAAAELSKLDRYTKKIDEAPNGLIYEENDIKYLTDKGYSRESAIDELSKCLKYKKLTASDIKKANKEEIKKLSERVVGGQIDKMLDTQIAQFAAQFGMSDKWDEEAKNKVRDIIRGNCNVVFANDSIVNFAKEATEKQLNKFFDEQLKNAIDDGYNRAQSVLEDAIANVNKLDKKRTSLDVEHLSSALVSQFDKLLTGNSAIKKLGNELGKLDDLGASLGVDPGIQKEVFSTISKISTGLGDSLAKSLQPKITKEIKIVSSVTARVKEYQNIIKKQQEKVQARLNEWKEQAKAKIKEQEQKLINSALGSLKAGIGSIKIKF